MSTGQETGKKLNYILLKLYKMNKKLYKIFGEKYNLIDHEGVYILYDKERQGKRSTQLYLGYFKLSEDNKFSFNEKCYSTVDELVEAMNVYNETLPFEAEIYNPMFVKHYKIECALHDYLESLGFKHAFGGNSTYYLEDYYEQKICTLAVNVTQDTTEGYISRLIPGSDKWTESSFTDLDSAIGAVNTILAMYCISINSITVNVLDKLTNSRVSEVFDVSFDVKSLTTYTEDTKQKTIEKLEKESKRLKGEI